jgi:hypothetical protein
MKLIAIAALAAGVLAVAGPAAAQDAGALTGLVSTVGEGLGESLGQSITGGQSIFVYATGKAKLPAAPPGAYSVQVTISAPTAVDAARQRDDELARLRAVAGQFGAASEVRAQSLSLGAANTGGFQLPFTMPTGGGAAGAGGDGATPPPKPQFEAKATLLLGEPAPGKAPAFLDALHAAGADAIASGDGQSAFSRLTASYLGGAPDMDPKVWDDATRDAIKTAHDQAATLAAAAGRTVGEARQILFLAKVVTGDEATVTVAVRFGFADGK